MTVTKSHSKSNPLVKISFYLLCTLLLITPLIFSEHFFSGFDLVKNSSLQIVGGLFIIVFSLYLLFTFFRDKQYSLFIDRSIDPFIILFVVGALLSTIFSLNQYVSFFGTYTRQIGFITFIYLFFIYFLSSKILRDEDKLKKVLFIMELTGVVVSVYSLMQVLQIDPFGIHIIKEGGKISSRPVTSLGHPNFAAGLLLLVLPFSLSNIFKNKFSLYRVLSPVIISAGIFVTQSRGSYVAFLAEILIFFFLYPLLIKQNKQQSSKIFKTGLIIISIIVLFGAALLILLPASEYSVRIAKIFNSGNDPRWLLWRDSLRVFTERPLTGTGIGLFPSVFENLITAELRRAEILSYYDNPHNNFINILCTLGILGFVSYILLLFQTIRISVRSLNENISQERKLIFYSAFISICGYIVFGITNFDDITILLYLFVIFAILKALSSDSLNSKPIHFQKLKFIIITVLTVLILFTGYNLYSSYTDLRADRNYQEGIEPFNRGDFKTSVHYMNEAILLNFGCAEYKYSLANNTYEYALLSNGLKPEARTSLLNKAKEELLRAEVNYHSKTECRQLLSLIYYETGNITEADRIKDGLLAKDTFSITYRCDLAMYYIKIKDLENAERHLKIVYQFAPFYSMYYLVSIKYWEAKENTEEVKKTCYELLKIEPGNQFAQNTLSRLK